MVEADQFVACKLRLTDVVVVDDDVDDDDDDVELIPLIKKYKMRELV
ncbi:MAG: hypothetical protein AAFY57_20690 [Cyanobacteria bacterium J06642_2]